MTNNLYSIPKLVQEGYIPIFEKYEMGAYDARNTKITVSRAAVLSGYYHKDTQLWRIPLVGGQQKMTSPCLRQNQARKTSSVTRPPTNRTHRQRIRDKSAARIGALLPRRRGFPTKLTWLKAIKNGQFSSWPGLTEAVVRRSFLESIET